MNKTRLDILLNKYAKDQCSISELEEIESYYKSLEDFDNSLPSSIKNNWNKYTDFEYKIFAEKVKQKHKNIYRKYVYYTSIAAMFLLIVVVGLFYHYSKENHAYTKNGLANILPGKNGAILRLASGKTIVLNDIVSPNFRIDGIGHISTKNGFVKFSGENALKYTKNIIYTPLGQQYKVELSDGTKVWLNAGSSIEFPTEFAKNKRVITVKGEAYLEIKHISDQPFIVNVNNHFSIKDIGTSFNISAYENDSIETVTVIEGEIEIGNQLLYPSQKLVKFKMGHVETQKLDDAADEIIWTKGLLSFNSVDYAALFRKISRCYNIPIVITGNLPNQHISGKIPINVSLEELLKILTKYDLKFNYENNTLLVSRK